MKVRVPYEYTAEVVKKGCRKPEAGRFYEWADLEIVEIDAADAPVAVRWNDELPPQIDRFSEKDAWGPYPVGGVRETRWHDGSHYWEVLEDKPVSRHGPSEFLSPAALEEMCSGARSDGNPAMNRFSGRWNLDEAGHPIREDSYRSVADLTRERELAAITARVDSLALIDGKLYLKGPEPVCRKTPTWIAAHGSYQGVVRTEPISAKHGATELFRADRFDEAAEAAIIEGDRGHVDSVNEIRRPIVLVPESIRYNDEEPAFLAAAAQIRDRIKDKPIGSFPETVGVAWFALRNSFETGTGAERLAAIEDALEAYASTGGLSRDDMDHAYRTLDRWRTRPIEDLAPAAAYGR